MGNAIAKTWGFMFGCCDATSDGPYFFRCLVVPSDGFAVATMAISGSDKLEVPTIPTDMAKNMVLTYLNVPPF